MTMAKMFYTLEEAAAKLGMSTEEVSALAESGQLQEFRDRDNLMFKVDQVDLLAGDDDDDGDGEISLADTGAGAGSDAGIDAGIGEEIGGGLDGPDLDDEVEPVSLSSSGSGGSIGLEGSGESTGVSIFDPEGGEEADANAETLVSGGGIGGSGFGMDAGSSGSGLSQLAFEPDDTSLGGNLLDEMGEESGGSGGGSGGLGSALGESALGASAGGALFEGDDASGGDDFTPAAAGAGVAAPMGVEVYDGAASGLFGGIALGSFVTLLAALAVMILGMGGGADAILAQMDQTMIYAVMGGSIGLMLLMGAIGWFILRRS